MAQPQLPKAKPVKELTEDVAGTVRREGVVDKIDADGLTLVEVTNTGEPKEYFIVPINLLRKGEVLPEIWGMYAYRWEDVKRGDTVKLIVKKDETDGVLYCMQICIIRRPGVKLPESQNPKKDHRYAQDRIYNDIDNGEDVSDEEIKKAFPPEFILDRKTGEKIQVQPGVTYTKYMDKLKAIREKKAKEPKQEGKPTPAEKK